MTEAETAVDAALDQLDAQGHAHAWRFRQLCADESDPEAQAGYRALVIALAAGEPIVTPATPPPAPVPVSYGLPGPGPCGGCP